MKLGCCSYSWDREKDPAGIASIPVIKKLGYDYIEMSFTNISKLSNEDFALLEKTLKENDIKCECCNVFFPGTLRLTGENADLSAVEEYFQSSFPRAEKLGVEIIVFGSAGAKNVPEGFSHEKAFEQIVQVGQLADKYAAKAGITIAIEPLNHKESNIIITVADGYELVKAINREHVKLLVDYYHWAIEKEGLDILETAKDVLVHAHFAEEIGRVFPSEDKQEYRDFMSKLKSVGYNKRISMECGTKDFENDAKKGLEVFRQYLW